MIVSNDYPTLFSPEAVFQQVYQEYPNMIRVYDILASSFHAVSGEFTLLKEILGEFALNTDIDDATSNGRISNETEYNNSSFHLYKIQEGLWLAFNQSHYDSTQEDGVCNVRLLYRNSEREIAQTWAKKFADNKRVQVTEGKIHLLFQSNGSFYTRARTIDDSFTCDIPENYGDEFQEHYDKLIKSLKEEKKGLYLLYSQPGCGKTSLIKQIIKDVKEQRVLFLPPGMSAELNNPSLLPFFLEEKFDLIILEDAEEVLKSREDGHSPISALLNITDGILGDILQSKILATFNTDWKNIDSALKRKGRLRHYLEFSALKKEYADRLLKKLGHPVQGKPMTLAEIYNFGEDNGVVNKEKGKMGFVSC